MIEQWLDLVDAQIKVVALECLAVDRGLIFAEFANYSNSKNLPLYYWNSGYPEIQAVTVSKSGDYHLSPSALQFEAEDILPSLSHHEQPGIYLLADLVDFEDLIPKQRLCRESQILNLIDQCRFSSVPSYFVLMGSYLNFSDQLREVETLSYPLPDTFTVEKIVNSFCSHHHFQPSPSIKQKLVTACMGLPAGEIELLLLRYSSNHKQLESIADAVLAHKTRSLRSLGLEFVAEPDVKSAGGLDLLNSFLHEKVVKLNEPNAKKYGLRPPRGMLLLGLPGTGKSLSAKLTAQALGYVLLAVSWGNILGAENPDLTLSRILATADRVDRALLLFDDFDKGFTGWQEGGVSRRLSQRLLTWMQEHTSHVMMMATINRLQLLPSELKRRFDDGGIWFVDLPSMGAMHEIFLIHLSKYFPTQFGDGIDPWTNQQWYQLLKAYRGATPVEIAHAVSRCAIDFYCGLSDAQREQAQVKPLLSLEALLAQLNQFVMASKRDAEDLQSIRNNAYYARPAASPDTSQYAISQQQLFDYTPHEFDLKS